LQKGLGGFVAVGADAEEEVGEAGVRVVVVGKLVITALLVLLRGRISDWRERFAVAGRTRMVVRGAIVSQLHRFLLALARFGRVAA
jgi:cytosine/uracil/thiamine/allantoin permease